MLFRPGTKPTEIVITLWLQAQSLTIAWKRHPIEQEVRLMVEANLSYRNPGECGPRLRINHFSGLSFWMISTSHFLWQRQQTCTFTETAFPQRTHFQMSQHGPAMPSFLRLLGLLDQSIAAAEVQVTEHNPTMLRKLLWPGRSDPAVSAGQLAA